MASSQTTNYGLNQWAAEDQVIREEFNSDNAKLETALTQLTSSVLQAAVGSYVGTGQYGSTTPNCLEFDFVPKLIILVIDGKSVLKTGTVLIAGQSSSAGIGTSYSSGSCLNLSITWEGNKVFWYGGDAERQMNEEGSIYFYFALG